MTAHTHTHTHTREAGLLSLAALKCSLPQIHLALSFGALVLWDLPFVYVLIVRELNEDRGLIHLIPAASTGPGKCPEPRMLSPLPAEVLNERHA